MTGSLRIPHQLPPPLLAAGQAILLGTGLSSPGTHTGRGDKKKAPHNSCGAAGAARLGGESPEGVLRGPARATRARQAATARPAARGDGAPERTTRTSPCVRGGQRVAGPRRALGRPARASPPQAPPQRTAGSPGAMNRSRTSTPDKAGTAKLWGCELNQEKRTWTFKPQKEGEQDCKVLLNTICLGEKVKEEMNLVEILPPASQEDKRTKPIIVASLQASVLPMVTMSLELSPPVTFQLRAGWGPVFLSGQERYEIPDLSWEEEEEEEEQQSEEEDDDDDDDDDEEVSLEESPVKKGKRLASQKQTSVAKKKKVEKEEEAAR
ncbi:nucleoplasmin-2 isoform X2 [Myotis daubentonii]|nr:nucleoplasmin-2 isoform X2 [Myotis daubentonii]